MIDLTVYPTTLARAVKRAREKNMKKEQEAMSDRPIAMECTEKASFWRKLGHKSSGSIIGIQARIRLENARYTGAALPESFIMSTIFFDNPSQI